MRVREKTASALLNALFECMRGGVGGAASGGARNSLSERYRATVAFLVRVRVFASSESECVRWGRICRVTSVYQEQLRFGHVDNLCFAEETSLWSTTFAGDRT